MTKNSIIITVIVALIVGAGAFFGGMKYQQSQASAGQFAQGNRFFAQGAGRAGGRGNFGGAIRGKIVSSDQNSITVQMQDGSSKIVNISSTTTIVKTDKASQSDLTNGIEVAVFGSANSDGSIDAQSVQLNPGNIIRIRMPSPSQNQ